MIRVLHLDDAAPFFGFLKIMTEFDLVDHRPEAPEHPLSSPLYIPGSTFRLHLHNTVRSRYSSPWLHFP